MIEATVVSSSLLVSLVLMPSTFGRVTSKMLYIHLTGAIFDVPWSKHVWAMYIPHFEFFFIWHLMHNRVPTYDKRGMLGLSFSLICSLCLHEEETLDHLFVMLGEFGIVLGLLFLSLWIIWFCFISFLHLFYLLMRKLKLVIFYMLQWWRECLPFGLLIIIFIFRM